MAAPVSLSAWGSFHVGGREVTIAGQAPREVLFTPGGVPAKVDPSAPINVSITYRWVNRLFDYLRPSIR